MFKKSLSFLSLIIISFAATGQEFNKAKLDSLFTTVAVSNKGMGSIAISKKGKIVYQKAIGYSDVSRKQAATIHTKYRIGSISKMFTAVMIFQLIDEGRLNINTPISAYFPDLPHAGDITIGNLLNHHSGLHNFTNDSAYNHWMEQAKTQAEMLEIIGSKPLDFEPGTMGSYSNSNYILLGYIIEKITQKKYDAALKERVTSKAGLTHTSYGAKINTQKDEAQSYEYSDTWERATETDMSIPHGAGAIISTPTDLVHFIEALYTGKLLSEQSFKQMTTITDKYGMGIFEFPFNNKKTYGHTGGIDGFSSMLSYFPQDSIAVAYCSNGVVYPLNDIVIGVLSIYFNVPYVIPSFKTLVLKSEELDQYLGIYSSTQIPLKITVTKEKNTLYAQATGQSSFPLTATGAHVFEFTQAGVILEFRPAKSEFTLKQGGGNFLFTKEK